MMPNILPNEAPIAIDGTKMPAGTLQPYVISTRNIRRTVATAKENMSDHRLSWLDLSQLHEDRGYTHEAHYLQRPL